jgi:hypothetical protein
MEHLKLEIEQLHINNALLFARLTVLSQATLGAFSDLLAKDASDNLKTNYLTLLNLAEQKALNGLADLVEPAALLKAKADSFLFLQEQARQWKVQLTGNE